MIRVYLNKVSVSYDSEGSVTTVQGYRERANGTGAVFSSEDPAEIAHYLKYVVKVGTSVEIRHENGIRSCMNKPSLWEDVLKYR